MGENVVKYLARYVRRTAFMDERIVAADDERVTFSYTDTATQARKECTLDAAERVRQGPSPAGEGPGRWFFQEAKRAARSKGRWWAARW